MKTLACFAFTFGAATLFAGCAGTQSLIGSGRESEITSLSSGADLLYVASLSTIYVFRYPKTKYVSEISFPESGGGQVCSDASGDIFAPVGAGSSTPEILEYAHGGSQPIKILESPAGSDPFACSVDPATGNLAVTNLPAKPASVEVYQNGSGTPKTYLIHGFVDLFYCTYDDHSDLFVTGLDNTHVLAVLRSGSSKFTNIALKSAVATDHSIQWDGTYVTLGSEHGDAIYRLKIKGDKAAIRGVTHLRHGRNGSYGFQYWIQGNELIKPSGPFNDLLGLWNYPRGGVPMRLIARFGKAGVYSATVSVGTGRPSTRAWITTSRYRAARRPRA